MDHVQDYIFFLPTDMGWRYRMRHIGLLSLSSHSFACTQVMRLSMARNIIYDDRKREKEFVSVYGCVTSLCACEYIQ
jgi:hypothetical protein